MLNPLVVYSFGCALSRTLKQQFGSKSFSGRSLECESKANEECLTEQEADCQSSLESVTERMENTSKLF